MKTGIEISGGGVALQSAKGCAIPAPKQLFPFVHFHKKIDDQTISFSCLFSRQSSQKFIFPLTFGILHFYYSGVIPFSSHSSAPSVTPCFFSFYSNKN